MPWIEERAIGGRESATRIRLTTRSAAVNVTSAGGSVVDDDVTVVFPAGAFGSSSDVSVTFLDASATARGLGPAQFRTASDSTIHRMVKAVALSLSVPATEDATITFAAPSGPQYTLWTLDVDGEWVNPIAPSASTGTSVSFTVPQFAFGVVVFGGGETSEEYALSEDVPEDDSQVFAVNEAFGDVVATLPEGGTVDLEPGDVIPEDSQVRVMGDGWVQITDPQGSTLWASDDTAATLRICRDGLCAPAVADIDFEYGYLRVKINALIEGQKDKLRFKSRLIRRDITGGVRGTVFDLQIAPCSDLARELALLNVTEGTVAIDSHGITVDAGDETTLCDGCPAGVAPSCNCLATDPQEFHTPGVEEFFILGSLTYESEQYCPSTVVTAACSLGDFTLAMDGAEVSVAGNAPVAFEGNRCRSTWSQSPAGARLDYRVETFVTAGGQVAADVTCNVVGEDGVAGGCLYKYIASP